MARIDNLVELVTDLALRQELRQAVGMLRRRQRFGLVFEEHIPETSALQGYPVRKGAIVRRKAVASDRLYQISDLDSANATIVPVSGDEASATVGLSELLVVKRFGDPIVAGLLPLDSVRRSENRPSHSVISGENYHALQLLTFTHESKIDLIYIDPPYNTGARDWKYNNNYVDKNDSWRHSKWLSFMEKRLLVAKRLLRSDGVMVITVDENEHAHLVLLLESLFPGADLTSVAIVHNPRGVQGDNFSYTNEFAVFVIPGGQKLIAPRRLSESEQDPSNFRNWGGESLRTDAQNCFYPVYVEDGRVVGFGDVLPDGIHPASDVVDLGDGRYEVWPIDRNGIERKWRYARQSVEAIRGQLSVTTVRGGTLQIQITKDAGQYKTVWQDPKYDASTHGTQLVNRLVGAEFPFPKSLYSTYEVLYACTIRRPAAIILDFFAGSGTTLHATCLLNAEDGGNRQCILVTNNEVEEKQARKLNRAGHFRGDPEYERHGIFEQVTKLRCTAAITGMRPDGQPVEGRYDAGDRRTMSDGFEESVSYHQLAYLDPDDLELGLSYELVSPVLWLAAGSVGPIHAPEAGARFSFAEGSPYAILFDDAHFRGFAIQLRQRPEVSSVFLVTDSTEAFAEMRAALPAEISVTMLYGDYFRSFRPTAERAL